MDGFPSSWEESGGICQCHMYTGFCLLNEGLFKPFTGMLLSKRWLLCEYLQHYCLKQAKLSELKKQRKEPKNWYGDWFLILFLYFSFWECFGH